MSSEGSVSSSESEVFVGGPNSPVDETPVVDTPTPEPKTFDESYVKQLREEAAKHRTEKQREAKEKESLMARLKEFEDAQLSESERFQNEFEETRKRAEANETRAREAELKYQLALAAQGENISDVKAAVKLADRGLIEFGDDGSIQNISDVISGLRNEYPSLFNPSFKAPNTGVTNPAKAPSEKKYTREDLKSMTPERRVELLESGALRHLL